ncbi:hypothetical protein BGZ91_007861, partial [Linnemannia elongata]
MHTIWFFKFCDFGVQTQRLSFDAFRIHDAKSVHSGRVNHAVACYRRILDGD